MWPLLIGLALAQESHETPSFAKLTLMAAPVPQGPPQTVAVSPGVELQAVVSGLTAGSTLRLEPGIYAGPLHIDRRLRLVGPGARLLGPGRGTVLVITGDDVAVEGL